MNILKSQQNILKENRRVILKKGFATVKVVSRFFVAVIVMLLLNVTFAPILYADTLPVASTVSLTEVAQIAEGMVVVAQESTGQYSISSSIDDLQVYGTIAAQPPVVFTTGENETPVITEGIAFVQVTNEGGVIERGDLLVTSSQSGVAMKASDEHLHVFAIALESFEGDMGVIQAEIGVEHAQLLRAQQREVLAATPQEDGGNEDSKKISFIRATIAVVMVVGALGFLLYSFRSLLTHGVVSLGRNPRAKGSIMTFSFANFVFALILSAGVVFIAVAILILPL